ncbi:hypothetical protein [Anaerophilus nitritogenes]|uniref:hypothetical protein n=1 Tax=Anaerophilus nitritogenes TaxID=2498136 RepID=UPI00101DC053|nr:hypothetical protein [Anaerophilus nitritogenes]
MNEADILNSTYFDKMTVYRKETITVDYEDKDMNIEVYKDIPCSLDYSASNNTNQTETANIIKYNPIIFCSPDLEIKAGDTIIVIIENGQKRKLKTGEYIYYPSHLEIPCVRNDEA